MTKIANDRLRYYRSGIRAAWENLYPNHTDSCSEAWNARYLSDGKWNDHRVYISDIEALVQFAWGWKWAAERFRDEWIGVEPGDRVGTFETLWT